MHRVERYSYGGDVVATYKITKHLTVTELRNPTGAHLHLGYEDHRSATLKRDEIGQLARLLDRISTTENDGVSP
jgi:hypothetical protein